MDSPADLIVVLLLVLGAGGFVAWWTLVSKAPPACAPDAKAQPQVVLGSRLAKGLAAARRDQTSSARRR